MVDGAALEKRWAARCLVGSNPTLSAERCWSGLSGAPGERVSPLATVGSNPTLSATIRTCQQRTARSNGWQALPSTRPLGDLIVHEHISSLGLLHRLW